MVSSEYGMSKVEVWEAEAAQERMWALRRKRQYQKIANGLAALIEKLSVVDGDESAGIAAAEDMIEEGGPVTELPIQRSERPYARALELDRRHRATRTFLGLDPLYGSCDGPLIQPEAPPKLDRPLTEADIEYSNAVNAKLLGKETS